MRHTIVVTGGCGFIGSHFVRLLHTSRERWRIVNLDNLTYAGVTENLADIGEGSRYRFVRGDITDAAVVDRLVRDEEPWAIVNFAAESHVDRSILDATPFLKTNVLGVEVLLQAARRHGVPRFLQISTDEVYGDVAAPAFTAEDAPLRPGSPYAASKAAADLLCMAFYRTYGTPVVIARCANNYGPFQFPEKLIPLMIHNAMVGEPLPVYGDGTQLRDWLYVDDSCDAILRVLDRGIPGAIYNTGTGEQRPNLAVVQGVCDLVADALHLDREAMRSQIQFVRDRPGHDTRYAMDSAKIRLALGWTPRVAFQDGLRETVRWYLNHEEWVRGVTSGEYKAYYDAVYARAWNTTS